MVIGLDDVCMASVSVTAQQTASTLTQQDKREVFFEIKRGLKATPLAFISQTLNGSKRKVNDTDRPNRSTRRGISCTGKEVALPKRIGCFSRLGLKGACRTRCVNAPAPALFNLPGCKHNGEAVELWHIGRVLGSCCVGSNRL